MSAVLRDDRGGSSGWNEKVYLSYKTHAWCFLDMDLIHPDIPLQVFF